MAPTSEVQRWSAAAVDWGANSTSTGISYALNQKLRDWIAVVNGNASNADKQLLLWKDETSSTSSSTQGMVMRVGFGSGVEDYFHWGVYGDNNTMRVRASRLWNDDGSNSGYGTLNTGTDYYFSDTQSRSLNGSRDVDLYIAYDTTEGKEFFVWGFSGLSSQYEDANGIFKNTFGQWLVFSPDNTFNTLTYDVDNDEVRHLAKMPVYEPQKGIVYTRAASGSTSSDLIALSWALYSYPGAQSFGDGPVGEFTQFTNERVGSTNICINAGRYYIAEQGGPNESLIICCGHDAPAISLGPVTFK